MICPKCNNSQRGDEECESCGIVFRKYYNSIVKKKLHEAIQLYDEGKYQVALDSFNAIVSAKIYREKQIDEKCEEYIKKLQEIIKTKEEQRSPIIKNTTESVSKNICPDCTTPINDGDKFCHNCGKQVKFSTDEPIDVRGDTEEKVSYFSIKSLRVSKAKAILYFTLVLASLILLVFIEKMYHKRTALSTPDASSLALTDSACTPPVKANKANLSSHDPQGYQGVKWGASFLQVKSAFPDIAQSKPDSNVAVIKTNNEIVEEKIFKFDKGKLYQVELQMYKKRDDSPEYLENLISKYGKFHDQKKEESRVDIGGGRSVLVTGNHYLWNFNTTKIDLCIISPPYDCSIRFTSTAYISGIEQEIQSLNNEKKKLLHKQIADSFGDNATGETHKRNNQENLNYKSSVELSGGKNLNTNREVAFPPRPQNLWVAL